MRKLMLAMAAIGLVAGACFGGSKAKPTAVASATGTAAAVTRAAVATPTATASPEAFRPVFNDATGAFVRLSYAPGKAVDAKRGVFFMDNTTGAVEAWVLTDAAIVARGDDPASCCSVSFVSDGNRFVYLRSTSTAWLLDRKAQKTLSWDPALFAFVSASPHYLLFEQAASVADPIPLLSGRFAFLDTNLQPVSRFSVPGGGAGRPPVLFSPDERMLIIPAGNKSWSDYTALDEVDVVTGIVRELAQLPATPANHQPGPPVFTLLRGGAEWSVAIPYSPAWNDSTHTYSDVSYKTYFRRYDWSGKLLAAFEVPSPVAAISPDGRWVAYEQIERRVSNDIADSPFESWSNVVVADGMTGVPVFRVRSASLYFGDGLGDPRWLSDSSAIPIAVRPRSPRQPGVAPWRYTGYALLLADPPRLQPLDIVEDDVLGPVPSPNRPGLFALGHTGLLDTATGQQLGAITGETWLGHIAPWGSTSGEMRFALPHGGHGGGGPGTFLSPRMEYPPFDSTLAFTVTGTRSRLNVRALPSASGAVSGCLSDGTSVVLSEPTPGEPNGRLAAWFADEVLWMHVRAPDGQEGWVSSQYLEW